ncbi:MAG: VCBS repeat-containing protein [Saprospiraceae bacterium]|nr:VCBS repeat-containing protein [Saprospiraceae bacterium]
MLKKYHWKYDLISTTVLSILIFQVACTTDDPSSATLFELLDVKHTGITFSNDVTESLENNILSYTNFYNGAGVALGDINNDGLVDIYLSANSRTGKLYLNRGDLEFIDITQGSGLDTIAGWKTGVTMVDINQDGFLDIYICRSGKTKPILRGNLLFINNGDQTFTESGSLYGLDSWSTSTQASFFDYDLDGDLDMYLLNHNIDPVREIFKNFHDQDISRYTGDQLFQNDGGHFKEVDAFVGINRSKLGAGLGVAISDFNNDRYPDIYVCNDFVGRDYLYFSNGDGTFTESALQAMEHISYSSMGVDAADIDNDGLQDLFVLDMRSSTNYGRKTNMASMNPEAFYVLVDLKGHHQYMRNTLQLNNGDETFSDIAPMAGVSSTDWSWAPLFADFDNDGWKDLLVTNGMRKNTNNKDFNSYKEERAKQEFSKQEPDYKGLALELLASIPPERVVNHIYRNKQGLAFEQINKDWGITMPTYSNGAVYGDLDNDGDMDLVINNIDEVAHVYQNNASEISNNHYIRIALNGSPSNRNGIGAKIMVQAGEKKQFLEQYVSRGYQSSVDYTLHFGLGQSEVIDYLKVIWPDNKESELEHITADQLISVDYNSASYPKERDEKSSLIFNDVTKSFGLDHRHQENNFDDFKREVLLPHKMSTFGPALAVGDINKDHLDDFFIGGAKGFEGAVYLQIENGSFIKMSQPGISGDLSYEDVDALFFDSDQDGDLDLYVVSGGSELPEGDSYYQDRLYINNGSGHFNRSTSLPVIGTSGGVVRAGDLDGDGDLDLFVGGRLVPGKYPQPAHSYLLENRKGIFVDITKDNASELLKPGMVTDALWSDYNRDGWKDLILVGEWMPITIFQNREGHLTRIKTDSTLASSTGWWFSIAEGDVNSDGRMDYILGNLGENYEYKAKANAPFRLYSKDFDRNGALDIVLSYFENDTLYPLRGKQCSSQQIPDLKKKFKDYNSFGLATLEDIYEADSLAGSDILEAKVFASGILMNFSDGFQLKALPALAQLSATFGIIYQDFDSDGLNDIVVAGNLFNSEVETPRSDAGKGLFLKGDGQGGFVPIRGYESGLVIEGDVKKLKSIRLGRPNAVHNGIIVGVNDDLVKLIVADAPKI